MADLTEPEPEAVVPDLTDLSYVTINVETNDGQQFSMVISSEDQHLEMVVEDAKSNGHFLRGWEVHITQRERE